MRAKPFATVLAGAALIIAGAANGQPAPSPKKQSALQALRMVFQNHDLKLGDNPSCQGLVDDRSDPTLGDWISWVLAEFEPVEGISGVEASCTGPADKAACEVNAQRRAGEEVWTWGVMFEGDTVSGKIDPATLKCNMAG